LWNNKNILYRGKTLLFKDWISHFNYIRDFVTDGDHFITFDRLCQLVGPSPQRLFEYNALRTALSGRTATGLMQAARLGHAALLGFPVLKTVPSPRCLRLQLADSASVIPCAVHFWQRKYNIMLNASHWSIVVNSLKEERLRLLHWKILHNIYPTNILLFKMGVKDSMQCQYCNERDYIEHFFWSCSKIKPVWKLCTDFIFVKTGLQIKLTETDVLFGYKPEKSSNTNIRLINHVIAITKMVISKFKYGNAVDIGCMFNNDIELRLFSLNV
jgi:hypothetical protein